MNSDVVDGGSVKPPRSPKVKKKTRVGSPPGSGGQPPRPKDSPPELPSQPPPPPPPPSQPPPVIRHQTFTKADHAPPPDRRHMRAKYVGEIE